MRRPGQRAVLKRAREVLEIEAAAVKALAGRLDGRFPEAVERILACRGRVVVIGIGKSGLVGRKLAATLSSTGTPALFLHPAEGLHGDLGALTAQDLALVLSYSGETEEIRRLLAAVRGKGIPVLAMTGRPGSRLGRWADLTLPVPVAREACPYNITPTASTTAMLALGDALAMCLMQRRGFGMEDFARLHPAGTLGKLLTLRVKDLMHAGAQNPVIRQERTVQDALEVMTRTRLGATNVVDAKGRLVGFFTDGDLRRGLQRDPAILKVRLARVMTRDPLTAEPDMLAADALKLIKRFGVDNLPVQDARTRRPVGILDERDLLSEGLA
jgi:arabinose-5-phosphate isomerase